MKILCKRTAPVLFLGYYETDDHLTFTRLKSPMIGGSINTRTLVKLVLLILIGFRFGMLILLLMPFVVKKFPFLEMMLVLQRI